MHGLTAGVWGLYSLYFQRCKLMVVPDVVSLMIAVVSSDGKL